MTASPRRVALLIEASRAYARGLIRGVAQYNLEHEGWSLYYAPRGLEDPPPAWVAGWEGDGVLARINDRRTAQAVTSLGVPVVDLRRAFDDLDHPTVGPDDEAVARLAFAHLLERGFRSFGFCAMPRRAHPPMDVRADCFERLAREQGHDCNVFRARRQRRSSSVWEEEQNRIAHWIHALPKPAGVMASNDDYGLLLLDACRRAGVGVPDEVAVVGAGDDECLCHLAVPPLSSVDLNPERIGFEAAALLDRMMDGEPIARSNFLVEPRGMVTRMSTDVLATSDEAVVRAVRFIRAHACRRIQVADVLRHVRMSRTALEPRVKAVLGRTVYQEIQRVQIERVKELLAGSDMPIKQVAFRTGFRYPEYMMRVFRRATGTTPARFRKSARQEGRAASLQPSESHGRIV